MTNFFSLNSKVVLIKEKTINASFDYKNESFIYIIASFVFINETCVYKNEICIYIIKAFIYRLQTAKRNFSIRRKKLCIGKKGSFLLIANVRDST